MKTLNAMPDREPRAALSNRINGIASSQIGQVADRGRDDPDVIKLWIGEGDLPTPGFIVEAAYEAMRAGHTRYTYTLGLPRLRQALSDYHQRHWNIALPANRFAVTVGGMNAIVQSAQAVLDAGDEVIVPTPSWPNLVEAMRLAGGIPVSVPYRHGSNGRLSLDLSDVSKAITPRTRAIIVNSPSNPTGWVMPPDMMQALVDLARRAGLWVIADEVYAHFTYDGTIAPSFLQICDERDRLIVTNTFSKNWAMTGWRAGWLVMPAGLEKTFTKLSEYNTTSIPTFIQHAAVRALDDGDSFIRTMVERCAASRAILVEGLSRLPGVSVLPPDGAFYLMAKFDTPDSSLDLALRLLSDAKVGVAPGTAFGPEGAGYARLCFAISPALAAETVRRLTEFFTRFPAVG
jgi:aspartate/methionine/tyrosine aminotransferase